jgi:minor extracellular protease Epr
VFPAAFANVIGVAGTSVALERSEISNYGEDLVSFSAPGEELVTSYPAGHYAVAFGTSFSAALASGTAALLIDLDERIDQYDLEEALARGRPSRGDMGHGSLDVFATLRYWKARRRGGDR